MEIFAFFRAFRLRDLAKIFLASAESSLPSESRRIGHRLHRGLDRQQFFFGPLDTQSRVGAQG